MIRLCFPLPATFDGPSPLLEGNSWGRGRLQAQLRQTFILHCEFQNLTAVHSKLVRQMPSFPLSKTISVSRLMSSYISICQVVVDIVRKCHTAISSRGLDCDAVSVPKIGNGEIAVLVATIQY